MAKKRAAALVFAFLAGGVGCHHTVRIADPGEALYPHEHRAVNHLFQIIKAEDAFGGAAVPVECLIEVSRCVPGSEPGASALSRADGDLSGADGYTFAQVMGPAKTVSWNGTEIRNASEAYVLVANSELPYRRSFCYQVPQGRHLEFCEYARPIGVPTEPKCPGPCEPATWTPGWELAGTKFKKGEQR